MALPRTVVTPLVEGDFRATIIRVFLLNEIEQCQR